MFSSPSVQVIALANISRFRDSNDMQGLSNRTACASFIASRDWYECLLSESIEDDLQRSVAYLLIYGALPTKAQHRLFEEEVMHHTVVHSDAEGFFRSFR